MPLSLTGVPRRAGGRRTGRHDGLPAAVGTPRRSGRRARPPADMRRGRAAPRRHDPAPGRARSGSPSRIGTDRWRRAGGQVRDETAVTGGAVAPPWFSTVRPCLWTTHGRATSPLPWPKWPAARPHRPSMAAAFWAPAPPGGPDGTAWPYDRCGSRAPSGGFSDGSKVERVPWKFPAMNLPPCGKCAANQVEQGAFVTGR